MEIHPPQEPVRSVRDFLYHMLTVVLGILIALSLEGLVQWFEHRHTVREARVNLTAEIQRNRTRLSGGLKLAPDAENRLRSLIREVQEARTLREVKDATLNLGYGVFTLSSINWSSAQTSGALGYMDPAEVQRYTRAYLLQEHFMQVQDQTLQRWLDLQKWGPVLGDKKPLASLKDDELNAMELGASAALIYTQTAEGFAASLIAEYDLALKNFPP